jgi:hypothetical protein
MSDPTPPSWLKAVNKAMMAVQARPVLRAFPKEVPAGVGFFKRAGLVQDGTPDEFEALAGRCAVFKLDPA